MGTFPTVDVLIVTYNAAKVIYPCLRSLSIGGKEYAYRVTVVDNASTDGTPMIIRREFPSVNLVEKPENIGFARANNQALQITAGEYVILLNPDTEVRTGGLDRLVGFLKTHPQVGVAGSKLLNTDGSIQLTGNTFPSLRNLLIETFFLDRLFSRSGIFGAHKLSWWDRKGPREVDWVMGACVAIPRTVVDQVGFFDERFFLFFEEVDLCRRIREAGYEVYYLPEAEVVHHGGGDYDRKKIQAWHESLFYYFSKYHRERLPALKCLVLVRSLIRFFLWLGLSAFWGRRALDKAYGYSKAISLALGFRRSR